MNSAQIAKRLWEDNFYPNEVLLWEGRTQLGFQFGNSPARRKAVTQLSLLLAVGLILAVAFGFVAPPALTESAAPLVLKLWAILGLAIALRYLFLCIRLPLSDYYAVTNRRALVAQNLIAHGSVVPHLLENVTVRHNGSKTGDISIVSSDTLTRVAEGVSNKGAVFLNIAEPAKVADLMQRVAYGETSVAPVPGTRHITPIRT